MITTIEIHRRAFAKLLKFSTLEEEGVPALVFLSGTRIGSKTREKKTINLV